MNTQERSSGWAFRALSLSLFVGLMLIAVASFMPDRRLWGVNHLAFYGLPVRLAALAFMALSFHPRIARTLYGAFLGSIEPFLSGAADGRPAPDSSRSSFAPGAARMWLLSGAAVLAGMVLLYLFRIDANVMSEGRFLPSLFSSASESGATAGMLIVNLLLFGLLAFSLHRTAPKSKIKRAIAVLLLYLGIFSGALALFAGYLSRYTPFLVCGALYVLFAYRYLRKNEWCSVPLIFLAIACFVHKFGIMLVPSGIYLLIRRMKGGDYLRERGYISLTLMIATVAVAFLGPLNPRWAHYYLPVFGSSETDGIVSPGHIADICNLLLLAFPALPLLLSIPAINRALGKSAAENNAAPNPKRAGGQDLPEAETSFAMLLFLPWLLVLVLLKPQQSLARNWDRYLLTMLGFFPLMMVGFKTFLQGVGRAGGKPDAEGGGAPHEKLMHGGLASVISPAVVVSLVMSLSWVGINRNPAKSVSRFENLLAFEKASAAQGYTQLAFYQANQGNMLAAITASEKAYSLDSSPGNFLNASIFYLSSEDTVRAIELLDRSIKDHPDAHTNRQALVSLLDQTARFADMTRVCKEGIQQQPDEPQYYYFLGKSYLYRGNLREGLLALKKCKDMSPPEPIPAYIDSLLARIRKVK